MRHDSPYLGYGEEETASFAIDLVCILPESAASCYYYPSSPRQCTWTGVSGSWRGGKRGGGSFRGVCEDPRKPLLNSCTQVSGPRQGIRTGKLEYLATLQ
jgi:hypothetical protein